MLSAIPDFFLQHLLFTGLLGDATEEFVENLDTQQGQLYVILYGYILQIVFKK